MQEMLSYCIKYIYMGTKKCLTLVKLTFTFFNEMLGFHIFKVYNTKAIQGMQKFRHFYNKFVIQRTSTAALNLC